MEKSERKWSRDYVPTVGAKSGIIRVFTWPTKVEHWGWWVCIGLSQGSGVGIPFFPGVTDGTSWFGISLTWLIT
jgi:hypothetical protein